MLKIYTVNYRWRAFALVAIFLDKEDCDKFMLEQKGAKLTVTETDDIIFKYNTFSQNDYVQFMGKCVNLGRLSYTNGQYETTCFTTPELREEATKLYNEEVRKRAKECHEFYNTHIWL